jgi:hypothetical protein
VSGAPEGVARLADEAALVTRLREGDEAEFVAGLENYPARP